MTPDEATATPPLAPTSEPRREPNSLANEFAAAFQGNANAIALQFGGPVYLVGSMLTSLTPGDIDVRCLVRREDLEAMFGADYDALLLEGWPPAKFRVAREELKQSRRLTRRWRRGRFDFQFQTALFTDDTLEPILDARPRIRMDRVPNEMFLAGHGNP